MALYSRLAAENMNMQFSSLSMRRLHCDTVTGAVHYCPSPCTLYFAKTPFTPHPVQPSAGISYGLSLSLSHSLSKPNTVCVDKVPLEATANTGKRNSHNLYCKFPTPRALLEYGLQKLGLAN